MKTLVHDCMVNMYDQLQEEKSVTKISYIVFCFAV